MTGQCQPPAWASVVWNDAQVCVFAAANGARYRVQLWVPPAPPPPGGYPVLCVLDGNALFGTVVEAVRRSSRRSDATGVQAMAVVAIAPDDDALFAEAQRRRDFTWGMPAQESLPPATPVGGGPDFLAWLTGSLLPQLQQAWPLDGARRALLGHSLAGYFVLRALAAQPGSFQHWVALSPSVWWNEAELHVALAQGLRGVAGSTGRDALRVFVGVGGWEDELPPWQRQHPDHATVMARRARRRMVAGAQGAARVLREELGPACVLFRRFPDEDHASVVMIGIQRALRFISGAIDGGSSDPL